MSESINVSSPDTTKMATVEIDTTCTKCGDKFDVASGVGNKKLYPAPGDISMCATCGHLMEFGQDMKLHDLDEPKRNRVLQNPRIRTAMKNLMRILETY